jgi:hypothetical protein
LKEQRRGKLERTSRARLSGMEELTIQQLAGILQRLTRAVVLQQIDITALGAIVDHSRADALDSAREAALRRASPVWNY